jgi:hypothetical protein
LEDTPHPGTAESEQPTDDHLKLQCEFILNVFLRETEMRLGDKK